VGDFRFRMRPLFKSSQAHHTGLELPKRRPCFLDPADSYALLVSDEGRRGAALPQPERPLTSRSPLLEALPDACAQSHSGRRTR
jgi:hypothetical protein